MTQQTDESDECEDNNRSGHTARQTEFLEHDNQWVNQNRKKCRQYYRDTKRTRVVSENSQQTRD
jgi:hypothetical protein